MKSYLLKNWKWNSLAIVLSLITALIGVGTSLIQIYTFQSIVDQDFDSFFRWMTILAAAWVSYVLINCANTWARSFAISKLNNLYRQDASVSLLNMTFSEYHANSSGEHLSTLTNDVVQVEKLAWAPFFSCIQTIFSIIFCFSALIWLHWSLAAASIATTILMVVIPSLFHKPMSALGSNCAEEQGKATDKMKDVLQGLDVLRSFGHKNDFSNSVASAGAIFEYAKHRLNYVKEFIGSGINLFNILCQMLINLLIGYLSISGYIPLGSLMGAGNLSGRLSGGLAEVVDQFLSFSSAKPFFEKVQLRPCVEKNEETVSLAELENGIFVKNLSFSYDKKPVIEDKSFSFIRGGKYALTGPSGCGKSTLLKLLIGWLTGYSGKILYDDQSLDSFTSDQLQEQISYIAQDVFLFNTTILENITLGDTFSDEEIALAVSQSALQRDVEKMPDGVQTIVGENGNQLSGGQRQRVAIARALLHKRNILLIDEGTSSLDKENADLIESQLLSIPDLTLILVSHHLTEARARQFTNVYRFYAS